MEKEIIWITTTIAFIDDLFTVKWVVFTVIGLPEFCLILALTSLPWGCPHIQSKADLEVGKGRETTILVFALTDTGLHLSNTVKNDRVSQLTFGKTHRDCCFAYCFERPVGEETCFDQSVVLNLQMWNYVMVYASMLALKHFVVNSKGHWE